MQSLVLKWKDPPFTPSLTGDNALKMGEATGKGAPAVLMDNWPGQASDAQAPSCMRRGALFEFAKA